MNFAEKEKLYTQYSDNYAGIRKSLFIVERHIRNSIIQKDRKSLKSLISIYMFLIGASAEARLYKILFEPNKFTEDEIITIFNEGSHLEKWIVLVKTAFKKKNNTKNLNVMPFEDICIYEFLIKTLQNELKIIIEMRNKLAHGQWIHPFVNLQSLHSLEKIKVSNLHKQHFKNENMLTLKIKKNMIDSLLNIVRDLVVSHKTLSRDVNSNYIRIRDAKINLKSRSYRKYTDSLLKKKKHGEQQLQNKIISIFLDILGHNKCVN